MGSIVEPLILTANATMELCARSGRVGVRDSGGGSCGRRAEAALHP